VRRRVHGESVGLHEREVTTLEPATASEPLAASELPTAPEPSS